MRQLALERDAIEVTVDPSAEGEQRGQSEESDAWWEPLIVIEGYKGDGE
jgi:hypothetical protein